MANRITLFPFILCFVLCVIPSLLHADWRLADDLMNRRLCGPSPIHFVLDSTLNTGNNSTIILTKSVADTVIFSGDEIGVFTQAGILCGAAKYEGSNLAVTVWEDDPATNNIVEGMQAGQAYHFKVWDASEQKECIGFVTFQSGINAYQRDAIEVIQNLALCKITDTLITATACNSYTLNNQTYDSSGVYTQVLTNIAGCDSIITLSLTINPVPVVTVNSDTICSGETSILTANGAESYIWNTGATTNTITVNPNMDTVYTVIGTTAGCTSTHATAYVTVYPIPTVTIGINNDTICAGQIADLTARGASTYLWNTGATTDKITVNPETSTIYTVTGMSTGCISAPASVLVTVNPVPVVMAANDTICLGQTAMLIATGAASYFWNTGATTDSINVSPDTTTTYKVTGITAGCTSTPVPAQVLVTPLPTVNIITDNTVIHTGEKATLVANGMPPGLNYHWSTGAETDTIMVDSMGTYTVTVTMNSAPYCTATDSVFVTVVVPTIDILNNFPLIVNPNPTSDIVNIVCEGAPTFLVQIMENTGNVVIEDHEVVLSGVKRTVNLKPLPAGLYYLQIVGAEFVKTVPVIKTF